MDRPRQEVTLRPVTEELLHEIVQRIVEAFMPERIILFGSYADADGAPTPESDIDLLVVMESDERPAARSARITRLCRPPLVGMDILVRTPEELRYRLAINDSFFKEILTKGRVLYERPVQR